MIPQRQRHKMQYPEWGVVLSTAEMIFSSLPFSFSSPRKPSFNATRCVSSLSLGDIAPKLYRCSLLTASFQSALAPVSSAQNGLHHRSHTFGHLSVFQRKILSFRIRSGLIFCLNVVDQVHAFVAFISPVDLCFSEVQKIIELCFQ